MIDKNTKTFTSLNWLGNMSPCKIIYNGEEWDSDEKLFQAMRFNDECIRQKIRNEKGIFKSNLSIYTVVELMSSLDIENLRTAMQLKFDQNKILQLKLLSTDNINLVLFRKKHYDPEDLFWGMTIIDEQWIGMNIVGKILMEIREKIKYFNN
jgi:predicted NAD-dependent protein-ADP-ribosyltransferase YbiA (DUF1768 family)